MRLLVLMLTFVLLTPLMGCEAINYPDRFEAENNAELFKKARENRKLNEQESQERKR